MLAQTWCLGYTLPELAPNPMDSCGCPRGDSPVRPLYSTIFGLVFHRGFGSLLLTTFFLVLFESWKGPAAP